MISTKKFLAKVTGRGKTKSSNMTNNLASKAQWKEVQGTLEPHGWCPLAQGDYIMPSVCDHVGEVASEQR